MLADLLVDRRRHFGSDVESKLSHLDDLAALDRLAEEGVLDVRGISCRMG